LIVNVIFTLSAPCDHTKYDLMHLHGTLTESLWCKYRRCKLFAHSVSWPYNAWCNDRSVVCTLYVRHEIC